MGHKGHLVMCVNAVVRSVHCSSQRLQFSVLHLLFWVNRLGCYDHSSNSWASVSISQLLLPSFWLCACMPALARPVQGVSQNGSWGLVGGYLKGFF
jgi:hypothetical protein